jgi:hypothetical protein
VRSTANAVAPGDIITLKAGTYAGGAQVGKSGTSLAPITIRAAEGEAVLVSGTGITIPLDASRALLRLSDVHHVHVQGIEFANLTTSTAGLPIGIWIEKGCQGLQLRDLRIHDIHHYGSEDSFPNAHGILVSGNTATPVSGLVIEGCELWNMTLGSSEALAVNGNVNGFSILGCSVHDVNNIGIDIIGYEGRAPFGSIDRARNGLIKGNTVYNVDSAYNTAYGLDPSTGLRYRAAGGIYVDGGTQCIIEGNHVYQCNFGIELASERITEGGTPGFCDFVTVRSNLVHHCHDAGIILGGYSAERGTTRDCTIHHNTFYQNCTTSLFSGQIALQYNVTANAFHHNILVPNGTNRVIINDYGPLGGENTFDYNCYYTPTGVLRFTATNGLGVVSTYTSLSSWRTRVAGEGNTQQINPAFEGSNLNVFSPPQLFRLKTSSPLIDAGNPFLAVTEAEKDLFGRERRFGSRVDVGMHEVHPEVIVPQPQTLVLDTAAGMPWGGLQFSIPLRATSSSGLPVSFALVTGPASLSGNILTVIGPGEIVLSLSQAGNAEWAAGQASTSIMVTSQAQPTQGAWLEDMGWEDGRSVQAAMGIGTSPGLPHTRTIRHLLSQQWMKADPSDFVADEFPPGASSKPAESVVRLGKGSYVAEGITFAGYEGPTVAVLSATTYTSNIFTPHPAVHAVRFKTTRGYPFLMIYANGEVRFRGAPSRSVPKVPWGQRLHFGRMSGGPASAAANLTLFPQRGYAQLNYPAGQVTLRVATAAGLGQLFVSQSQEISPVNASPVISQDSVPFFTFSSPPITAETLPNTQFTGLNERVADYAGFLNRNQTRFGAEAGIPPIPLYAGQHQFSLERDILPKNFQMQLIEVPVPELAQSILTSSPWGTPHPQPAIAPFTPDPTPLKIYGNIARFKAIPTAEGTTYQLRFGTTIKTYVGAQQNISYTLPTRTIPYPVAIRRLMPGMLKAEYGPWEELGSLLSVGVGETVLATPAMGATSETLQPLFSWSPTPGALSYKLTYKKKGSRTGSSVTVLVNVYQPIKPLAAATEYEWSVTPLNGRMIGLAARGSFRTP